MTRPRLPRFPSLLLGAALMGASPILVSCGHDIIEEVVAEFTIQGSVTVEGTGIENVGVHVTFPNDTTHVVRTGSDGGFAVAPNGSGRHTLMLTDYNRTLYFFPDSVKTVDVVAGTFTYTVSFVGQAR